MAIQPVLITSSVTPLAVPTSLNSGEIGINEADGRLFFRDILGVVQNFDLLARSSFSLLATANANNDTFVDFNTFISNKFEQYIINIIDLVPQINGSNVLMRLSNDGGVTFNSGTNYNYTVNGSSSNVSGVLTDQSQIATSINLSGFGVSNVGSRIFNSEVHLYNPFNANVNKTVRGRSSFGGSTVDNIVSTDFSGVDKTNLSRVDAVRFLMSSGDIVSGEFKLYGVEK